MSNKKVLLLALFCGLMTAIALNFYLKSVQESVTNVKTKSVAVANARIPEKTLITANMVTMKDIPAEYVNSHAVSDMSQVVGSTARAEIEAGEQILDTKVVKIDSDRQSLAYSIPLGMRAISIKINEQTGVGGLLKPGDRVDVLGTVEVEIFSPDPNVNTTREIKTHVLLQNAEVLAVGTDIGEPKAEGEKNSASASAGTVTLAVPNEKTQLVAYMASKGDLYLTLRAPADNSIEDRPSIDSMELLK
ncbi:Flp pilus assembly protein CpaB [Phosphitispora sp. TUW77]|uniref:Flp pilus assembly protein CpaB n=1 Tax=Phosphitispora sp. TUW77 TaxID=3152361 RepID=UPI003AB1EA5C